MRPVSVLLALALATACSPAPKASVAVPKEPVERLAAAGNFTLYVSNQSFHRPTVDIAVVIDGERVAGQAFEVKGQHNWVEFGSDLAAGVHQLRAVSEAGRAELNKTFTTGARNWAVIDYWCCGEPDDPKFTFHISDQPLAFG